MKLKLPIPPSTNKMYRNVPGVGRVKTSTYKTWIGHAGFELHRQMIGVCTLFGPVVIDMAIPTNNRRDLDNHAKPIIDLLVKHQIIESDRCKTVRGISMRWHDGGQCEVTIEPSTVSNESTLRGRVAA